MGWAVRELVSHLRALGVREGDRLAVHSSMKALGWVQGGAPAVLDTLKSAVGDQGTLLMPTMTPPLDRFIVAETPSYTGLLTETLRRDPGAVRSWHPTHSAAVWGRDAAEIASGHPEATALGVGSPFHRLAERGGKVLLLGVDCCRNSLIHVGEALSHPPYFGVVFYPGHERELTMVLPDGREVVVPPRDNPGCSGGFNVVQDELAARGQLMTGTVGDARSYLMLGEHVLQATQDLLARDPAALLCADAKCAFCTAARECCRDAAAGGQRVGSGSGHSPS